MQDEGCRLLEFEVSLRHRSLRFSILNLYFGFRNSFDRSPACICRCACLRLTCGLCVITMSSIACSKFSLCRFEEGFYSLDELPGCCVICLTHLSKLAVGRFAEPVRMVAHGSSTG